MTVFVHPRGLCESDDVGDGTRVWAFAHVLPGARIGRDCNICDGAFVESGAVLGDRVTVKNGTLVFDGVTCEDEVFLGPNTLFTNDLRPRAAIRKGPEDLLSTVVRRGATLGAGTVVVCGTEIGEHAFAAAGSVVTRDVAAHSFVAGNPALHKGWVCSCGVRLDAGLRCPDCGRAHEKSPSGSGLRALEREPIAQS
ncbi:acyltransferase [Umezawaea endophytica]|uniref:N-acetyltransferase n=1 Tax=Umezawaea endophytica TaxID=1654476 RepID=A0A9X2VRB9_9PSEU|nr:acyltransferase [Umezawaea endophytica]MCS7481295.1 N-acetyltransferase [Umezawaea endophytica]